MTRVHVDLVGDHGPAVRRGILRLVPRTDSISTTELIRRVRDA